ncbi:MAG: hypothetical protein JWO05_2878 [Gemmatimonadetes bacterium]|nr:hypothetical protein [Gemmatimonadota bacterium]
MTCTEHDFPLAALEIVHTAAGTGLRATCDIPVGTAVMRFDGPVVAWGAVPPDEVRYVAMHASGDWIIPGSPERFINHSCAPNTRSTESGDLVTTRHVPRGEELTMSYDTLEPFEIERRRLHPDWYFWDDRWSFDCACGASNCRGRIDRYVIPGER